MRRITTAEDVRELSQSPNVAPSLAQYLEAEFHTYAGTIEEHSRDNALIQQGVESLTLLQDEDDLVSLGVVGDVGYFVCFGHEYIVIATLPDRVVYKIAVLRDNECMSFYYLDESECSDNVIQWLEDHMASVTRDKEREESP